MENLNSVNYNNLSDEEKQEIHEALMIDELERMVNFLSLNPFPQEKMSVDEKKEYFKPLADLGDWLWSDDYYSKKMRAFYHLYYNFYLGTDKSFLTLLDLSK